jgi:hypothetical protein
VKSPQNFHYTKHFPNTNISKKFWEELIANVSLILHRPYSILTYLRNWALLEKLPVVQLLKNFPTFLGTRSSSPCSQEPYTGPYPEPDRFSPYYPILSL